MTGEEGDSGLSDEHRRNLIYGQFQYSLEMIASEAGVPYDLVKEIADEQLCYLEYDEPSGTVSPRGRDTILIELLRRS